MVEVAGTGFQPARFPTVDRGRERVINAARVGKTSAPSAAAAPERMAEIRLAQLLARLSGEARRADEETSMVQLASGGKPRGSVVDILA